MQYGYEPSFFDLSSPTVNRDRTQDILSLARQTPIVLGTRNMEQNMASVVKTTRSPPDWLLNVNRPKGHTWCAAFRTLNNISLSVRDRYIDHFTKREFKRTPTFAHAVKEIFDRFNKLPSVEKLDYTNLQTRELVESKFQKSITDKRKKDKNDKLKQEQQAILLLGQQEIITNVVETTQAIQPEFIQQPATQQTYFRDSELVAVLTGNRTLKCFGKVTNSSPMDEDGLYLLDSVEVKVLVSLSAEAATTFGRLVIEKKHLVKTDVSLSTINIRIGSLLEGENHIRSIEDEVEIDENNENADLMSHCRHAVGDMVVFDLGEIYADNWPLIAEIVAITQGGRKFKIKWFWANNYVGSDIMSQPFEEWKQNGETLTGLFEAKKHFCCNFFLENGKLPPEVVRKIRERMINK